MSATGSTAAEDPAVAAPLTSGSDGRYVNRQLLASIEAFLARSREDSGRQGCNREEVFRIEQFLYQEARLLDGRRYQEWLDLLAADFIYWVPSSHLKPTVQGEVAVNFDDRRRMEDRIAFTSTAGSFAQSPPSRTLRLLTNVQAWHGEGGSFEVSAGLVIMSYRRGSMSQYAGHLRMLLQAASESFQIRIKIIELLDCDEPQGNNTFIL